MVTPQQLGFDALGRPLIDTTFVVLDLETTGLVPGRDRITEVGAVKVRGGEVLGELQTFVHPGTAIPPAVTAVTGITDAMVRDAPPIGAVLPALLGFLGDAVLVAHNARFDVAFLRAEIEPQGRRFDPVVVDTARLARRLLRDEVRDCRLATVARHLRARTRPEHRALADARATVDVLHGLIERAGTLGATTVEELRDLARSTSDRAFRRIGMVRDAPPAPGVYRFLDARGEVLYVGKATDLRARLRTYFGQDPRRRIADLVREAASVAWDPTPTVLEAEVRELRAIHLHRPRYNRRSNRPEAAAYVALTREAFPRLSIARRPGPGHRWTLGPLPSRRAAEQVVAALHDGFAVRSCTPRLRRAQDHTACVLKQLGRCGAPCDGTQSSASYARVIEDLEGAIADPACLLESLRRRMLDLAGQGRFEQAGEARTRLHALARTLVAGRRREAISCVDRLVAVWADRDDAEVVVIHRGRLVGTARVAAPADDDTVMRTGVERPLEVPVDAPARQHADEVALLIAWLDRPGVRIVEAHGTFTEPVPGGAALAATLAEAHRVDRQVRRDRQVLNDTKVARREAV